MQIFEVIVHFQKLDQGLKKIFLIEYIKSDMIPECQSLNSKFREIPKNNVEFEKQINSIYMYLTNLSSVNLPTIQNIENVISKI